MNNTNNIDTGFLVGIVGIIISIFSIILAYIFYKKGIKTKKLLITAKSTLLISKKLSNYDGLKILYNNEEIQSLSSTIITISNVGNDIIESADIVPILPITVLTSNKFLQTDSNNFHITSSNPKTNPTVEEKDKSTLIIHFDFMRPKDEITITLLHNGKISVDGDLKNGKLSKVIDANGANNTQITTPPANDYDNYSSIRLLRMIRMMIFSLFSVSFMGILLSNPFTPNAIIDTSTLLMLLTMMIIMTSLYIISDSFTRHR